MGVACAHYKTADRAADLRFLGVGIDSLRHLDVLYRLQMTAVHVDAIELDTQGVLGQWQRYVC